MSTIRVLDCTLRDGGYINNWQFGKKNIKYIINKLEESNIDIIECGYLNNKKASNDDSSLFNDINTIAPFINKADGCEYVCMVNYGDFDISALPPRTKNGIDGIRVAFHKKNIDEALEYCSAIKAQGYNVYVQPMVSLSYTDKEFLDLIEKVNQLNPYAFYIVDSFGVMRQKDLMRLFYIVEQNLSDNIYIGYHSHNNLQLAYSNAQSLVALQTNRNLIIDSSIFGMGRGAGNLNTELFLEFLNNSIGTNYKTKPLLQVMDQVLNDIYMSNYWGYSLPHYLSAIHNCHPNYASYLDGKKTLTVEDINAILSKIPEDNKVGFKKEFAEQLYLEYMSADHSLNNSTDIATLFKGKNVVVVCPGRSGEVEKEKILDYIKEHDCITVSVNFDYAYANTNYIFLSNLRRLQNLNSDVKNKTIVTSNIKEDGFFAKLDYEVLVNNKPNVSDNAGLMLVKFLIKVGASKILLAGVDGYSHDAEQNYATKDMTFVTPNSILEAMNAEMSEVLTECAKMADIEFLTSARFVRIGL